MATTSEDETVDRVGNVILLLLFVPACWWWAFCAQPVWGWFVVPLGAPMLGKAHLYGLLIVRSALFMKTPGKSKWSSDLSMWIFGPPFILLCGFITHLFMVAK